ncbi:Sodium-dependent anion transporter family [hydrothermal vent metagenome]|uniref:Sodium-dependent anion transporter family n=1 Tax=hydrothermal vent metagenome TaxID=652676 RepID=A0A3B0RFY8_9ZZZZ
MRASVRKSSPPIWRGIWRFLQDKRWLLIAILVGIAAYLAPTPEGLSREGQLVLVISVVSVVLFVTEPVPLPAVAFMIMVSQVLLLGRSSTDVAQSLMSDSVLFIMGSLMLAVAVVKQKLDKRLAYMIVRMSGTKTRNVAIGIATVSGLLASVIGEHTVAAMMLPVALTLITLTSDDPKKVRGLAAVLLFSIAYGCSIAGIGTPSGGARNAIMVGYWKEFFYNPDDPNTAKYLVDYVKWVIVSYPVFLAQLPFITIILFTTFKPEYKHLTRAVVKLRTQIELEGPMQPTHFLTIGLFFMTLMGWIFFSNSIGLGMIALMGGIAFMVFGLVRWEDLNSGVNWGVVWLYAAAISLGIEMKDTGAALWLADSFLKVLPASMEQGVPLLASVSVLTTLVTNTMSNGAAVAVLGPITLNLAHTTGASELVVGFVTAISSAFAYLTVIGTPACTIVYASGYLKTTDFLKVGYKMVIMSTIILLIFAAFYWPMIGL